MHFCILIFLNPLTTFTSATKFKNCNRNLDLPYLVENTTSVKIAKNTCGRNLPFAGYYKAVKKNIFVSQFFRKL